MNESPEAGSESLDPAAESADTEIKNPDFADFVDPDIAAQQMARQKRSNAARGGVLGAAMLAVGDLIEPNKTDVTIEQAADTDGDDPLAGLDFGDLPPLS